MSILHSQKVENPKVLKKINGDVVEVELAGIYYRVFPQSWELKYLRSFELHVDYFSPAMNEGDGIIVSERVIGGKKNDDFPFKMPVFTKNDCDKSGVVREITKKMNVRLCFLIMESMQRSMSGRDAVWVNHGKGEYSIGVRDYESINANPSY